MSDAYRKNRRFFSFLAIFLIGFFALFFTGCSNPTSGSFNENNQTVSLVNGKVQKGKFLGGELTVQALNSQGKLVGKIIKSTITSNGEYSLKLKGDGLHLFRAKGKFFNEYTGKNSTEEAELFALVNLDSEKATQAINLNLFTSLEYSRVVALMREGKSYKDALDETKLSMQGWFGIDKDTNATALDIYDINGTLKEENKNLLLFSATLLKVLEEDSNSEKLTQKSMQKFTKSNFLKLYGDFADNGKLDGDSIDTFRQMGEDNESDTFTRVTGHLGLGNDVEVSHRDWVDVGATGITFHITEFSLKAIEINGTSQNYNNETALYIGTKFDVVRLVFDMKSVSSEPVSYRGAVYAIAGNKRLQVAPYEDMEYKVRHNDGGISTTSGRYVRMTLELRNFFKEAYRNGEEIQFELVSDVRINAFSVVRQKSDTLPKFIGLSNKLTVNGVDLNITSIEYLSKVGSSCNEQENGVISATQSVQYARFNMDVKWRPSENWTRVDGNLTNGCIRLDYNNTVNSFDLTLVEENVNISTDITSTIIGGVPIQIIIRDNNNNVHSEISPAGVMLLVSELGNVPAVIAQLSLPINMSHHISAQDTISPLGGDSIEIFARTKNINQNWDELQFKTLYGLVEEFKGELHSDSLPFFIEFNEQILTVDMNGLHIPNVSAKYVHQGDSTQLISNDISFSNSTGTFNITINENGLQTDTPIHFDAVNNVKTHFPYAQMSQGAFDVNIVDGEIVPVKIETAGKYAFGYSSTCQGGASCSEKGSPSSIAYDNLSSSGTYLAKDGAFMSEVDIGGKKIAWGSQNNSKYIFERNSDTKGLMYVPGFSIDANTPEALVSTLLGSRDLNDEKLSTVHTMENTFSKEGNGLFAGLNVGALYLTKDKTDPLTSLAGTTMQVEVGGATKVPLHLTSNSKSKYYIRPSGVTGVFNGALQEANEDLSIYGYPMTFKSFAFSQVANKLNEKTLIDGAVAVVGKGGFKVDFSSLALDCTGALNGGVVEETDCTKGINCNQTLDKWKTKTAFVSVDFSPNAEDVCADKTLKIGHVLDVKALTNPLGLVTTWLPSGDPKDAVVSGSSSNFLDRDEHNSSSKGFSVTLDTGTELTSEGWYKFSGAFGLPFWGMQAVDMGLTNKTETKRDLTRVMPQNILNQTTYESDKPQRFMASYQWGSTGFGFELPVYYERDQANGESIFNGEKLEIDLGVMNANAGINYIKPNKTKISFGASADFEAIGNLQIKVDLNDPESIKKIDNTLDTFGIGGNPIYSTLGLVLDPLHEAEAYADKGLLLGMEELGVKALEKGADEAGLDPFEIVADNMVKMHTLPIQAIDLTEEYIVEKFDSKIGEALGLVNGILNKTGESVNDELNASKAKALALLDGVIEQFDAIDEIRNQLHDVNETLNLMNIGNAWNLVDTKISTILPKEPGKCKNSLNTSELFKPVMTLKNNISSINSAIQAIPMGTVKGFASKVDSKIGYDTSYLVNSFEKTQRISASLMGEITTAQGRVDREMGNLCGEANTIRGKIKTMVDKASELDDITTKLTTYITAVDGKLNDLDSIEGNLTAYRDVLSKFDPTISTISEDKKAELKALSSMYLLSYIEEETGIATLKNDLKERLKAIPQPTADELRHMVVVKILDSEPVANIRIAMNDAISPVMDEVRETVVELFASVNTVIYDVLAKLSDKANKALSEATSAVASLPIKSGKMDGYALISGDELDRLHIGAEWAIDTGDEDSSYSFNGALDMERWGAGSKAGCGGETSTDGNMDVKISTRDIDLTIGGKEMSLDELYFGFTLANALPVGVMGGIESKAGFDFNQFALYDMRLDVGIGLIETYLGAKSAAIFDVYQMNVAFLVGKTCGDTIIKKLDPEVGKFITLPNNVFKGVYIRGGASFPVWDNGCALTVGVTADLGAWALLPGTYGGLVAGGAYGKALCIAALKGQVKVLFQKSGDNLKFQGSGWGAAGIGYCSPSKWHSVAKSRKDSWCGTGDAQFGAEYNDGWKLLDINTDAVF